MSPTNPEVDDYLRVGCGRCELVGTPECKVQSWQPELRRLREILLDSGLTEERKWGSPCYTFEGSNISMLGSLRESCTLSFFKGALLKDPKGILQKPGENSQSARVIRFTEVAQIDAVKNDLRAYIAEAIDAEKQGLKVEFKKNPEPMPEELIAALDADPKLKTAWEALTPGRQRGYILHISGAKQSATRTTRIKKWAPQIMRGKGMHDRG